MRHRKLDAPYRLFRLLRPEPRVVDRRKAVVVPESESRGPRQFPRHFVESVEYGLVHADQDPNLARRNKVLERRRPMTTKSRPKQARKNEAKASASPFPLAEEVRTYDPHLPGWADRQGQFVVIRGRDVLGFYPCHEDALEAGYDQLGR